MIQPLSGIVLDASAVLAYLRVEPGGAEVVAALAGGALMNTVNYAEVLTRLADAGEDAAAADRRMRDDGLVDQLLRLEPVGTSDAVEIARLRRDTRAQGLSLGDRACLATARRLQCPVLTADRSWAQLEVGISIRTIR